MATEIKNDKFCTIWYVEIVTNRHICYLILLGDGGETPLFSSKNKIILCQSEGLAIVKNYCTQKFFKISFEKKPVFVLNEELIYDTILNKDRDNNCLILNFLNTFFDCHKALGIDISKESKSILYPFADHLTFNKEFNKTYFRKNNLDKNKVKTELEKLFKRIWQNKIIVIDGSQKIKLFNFLYRFVFLYEKANAEDAK